MLRPRFHTAQALTADELTLEAGPSRHIARTLRMREGDVLCVFDGKGNEARASITRIDRDAVSVQLSEVRSLDRESPLAVALAVAVSRGDRMDTVVQKATELGVARIQPLLSERTGVRLDARRWSRKVEHWQRVAISACEQCGRNTVPEVAEPLAFTRYLDSPGGDGLRLILDPAGEAPALPVQCDSATLLVGPEGGFSEAELDAAQSAGFQSLLLGPRILRTETAPLVALSLLQARWGDLSAGG